MCGIAGILRSDGRPADREVLARMAARLAHRGPDEEAVWIDPAHPAAGLAVRRLAVIDPAGSRQPLAAEDGHVRLVYNGEIYNFRDLRRDLEAEGHAFATAGDGEPIVHLWQSRGPACLDALDGQFALALWDAGAGDAGRLMLARDRLGLKPLYWHAGSWGLAFASEVEALLEVPEVPRRIDRAAIADFLRFGYVPAPATGFVGVQKLAPGHRLLFDAATGRLDGPDRWWDIPRGPVRRGLDEAGWDEAVREALAEAVRRRMVADVPLGVLLSGGIDSAIVTALAAQQSPGRLRTFTVRFGERRWDESAYARDVAAMYGTDHAEVDVAPRAVEAAEDLVRRFGEPFADSSAVAVWHLAREVRRRVTVALSGDGGDESFGGYPRHGALAVSERLGYVPRVVLARLGRWIPAPARRKSRRGDLRRFLAALPAPPMERYLAWRSLFPAEALAAMLEPGFADEPPAEDPLARWARMAARMTTRPLLDKAMAIDLQDYLPDDCLAKVDRASMRHALEVRCPMLDHRVVELARRMPVGLKWRDRGLLPPRGKEILRRAFADRLPAQTLRRGKMGFGVPVGEWLAGPHAGWMRGILLDPAARWRGMLRPAAVEGLIDAHAERRADHGERLWALVCLELWLQAFRPSL